MKKLVNFALIGLMALSGLTSCVPRASAVIGSLSPGVRTAPDGSTLTVGKDYVLLGSTISLASSTVTLSGVDLRTNPLSGCKPVGVTLECAVPAIPALKHYRLPFTGILTGFDWPGHLNSAQPNFKPQSISVGGIDAN